MALTTDGGSAGIAQHAQWRKPAQRWARKGVEHLRSEVMLPLLMVLVLLEIWLAARYGWDRQPVAGAVIPAVAAG